MSKLQEASLIITKEQLQEIENFIDYPVTVGIRHEDQSLVIRVWSKEEPLQSRFSCEQRLPTMNVNQWDQEIERFKYYAKHAFSNRERGNQHGK